MTLAEKILDDIQNDNHAFEPGHRNDCVVNSMIACRYLDKDWAEWFDEHWTMSDGVQEHVDRVEPYLGSWFAKGKEEALGFLV